MLVCRKCGISKPAEEFDRRSDTGKRHTTCKACRRLYQRERYRCANPPVVRAKRILGASELFTCTRCVRALPAEAFPRKARGSPLLQSWCRECFSEYNRTNYSANRERETKRIRANQQREAELSRVGIREYLLAHPCVDCGETDPDVLEFDHLHDKRANVSEMVSRWTWRAILREIEKCEVRCANCHRRKTKERRLALLKCDPGAIRTPDQQLRRLSL